MKEQMTDEMNKNQHRSKLHVVGIFIIIALLVGITIAWFYQQQGLQTLTQVAHPITLTIKGKNKSPITQVDLSQIDLTKEDFDFIFCVVSNSSEPYQIELAHTTNIPFTYTMYKATRENDSTYTYNNSQFVINYTGKEENIQNNREKGYINYDSSNKIANTTQHENTYSNYHDVQKNAEPLYWLSESLTPIVDSDGDYLNYYVLKLSWDNELISDEKIRRETDLVYLMAEECVDEEREK